MTSPLSPSGRFPCDYSSRGDSCHPKAVPSVLEDMDLPEGLLFSGKKLGACSLIAMQIAGFIPKDVSYLDLCILLLEVSIVKSSHDSAKCLCSGCFIVIYHCCPHLHLGWTTFGPGQISA